MAADKKAAPAGGDDDAKQKKKKLFMMIGIGVLLVLISVGATVGALKVLSPATPGGAEEHVEEHADVEAPSIYYPLTPNFTVNYDVNGRQRFLQTELTLMYHDPELLKTLELHMPEVRNSLVLLLSSQTFDDLQTVEGKESLREAALEKIQAIIAEEQTKSYSRLSAKEKENYKKEHGRAGSSNIEQVLFTHFVMQ